MTRVRVHFFSFIDELFCGRDEGKPRSGGVMIIGATRWRVVLTNPLGEPPPQANHVAMLVGAQSNEVNEINEFFIFDFHQRLI